jgi:nicotinamide-nucleotide amidase
MGAVPASGSVAGERNPPSYGLRTMPPAENCILRALAEKAQPIVDVLRDKNLSVVTAESCTAGLIAAILSHAPHAGECLHGGFVVYSKEHKASSLGVDAALLKSKGSVNAEVALQMAQGALLRSSANVSLAVTGVLGPDPDEDANPAGLVYFAACREGREPLTLRKSFAGANPDAVRRCAVEHGLELLLRIASV